MFGYKLELLGVILAGVFSGCPSVNSMDFILGVPFHPAVENFMNN